ncbi:threonyl-tRNA synthetase [Haloactinospora alba]|uniref:Threonine--tRNA ligase n=1 Tax=Haloactinospora alba TaxID=405555 RepID=A0A543NK03_9ACTN|nr:threonine--tRNA ligase [Haloactinospora alba]TQN32148.1 threonyl-tRNA synthetase [Haloactinospora alba]
MSAVSEPRITLAGTERSVAAGTTAGQALEADGRTVIAARVNGELHDLATELSDGDSVEPVAIDSDDGRAILRHSTAHVLAQAVQELFPEAKLGIGPPVDNGFYYDFDVTTPFTPQDLKRIEKKMTEIIKQGQRFDRRAVTEDDARAELSTEPYKLELIGLKGGPGDSADGADVEVGSGELTVYDNIHPRTGELCWKDLCRGPHLPTTKVVPAFKLMRSAAAYWRGSELNPQLQRIYGTAWESKEALQEYLTFLEEAEKRDHRKLGAELDLFSFPDELGPGLAVFHPKGGVVRTEMERYSRRRHEEAGYEFVNTPHLSKAKLFETSGHLPNYAEAMFPPMEFDGQDYYLKAMNCPMHNLVFKARGRSYRELPLRMFEFGTVYRYEKSGVVHGLTRARGFTQDDAHIYCAIEQMPDELDTLLTFVLDLLRDYGLSDFYLELSTRGDSDKFLGGPQEWESATEALRRAADKQELDLVLDPGGAAYYGPKISVQAKDAIGRTWQMSTIQVDLQQPKLFDLEYTAADGSRQRPVMIHRALFGSIERFFGVLLEHYAGAFPAWLAPVQVVGVPIADEHVAHLEDAAGKLRSQGIRVEVDSGDDRMQKKIRNAQKQKVPFMLLAGDDDVSKGAVSFRYRDGSQNNAVPVDDAVAEIVAAVREGKQV